MPLKIRYRAPSGGGTLDLDDDATVAQLFDAIRAKTAASDVAIKYGWPPQALAADQAQLSVLSLNLHRENLTVIPAESATPTPASATPSAAPAGPAPAADEAAKPPRNIHDTPVTVKLPTDTYLGKSDGPSRMVSVGLSSVEPS
jgi:ubiquitin thioesterase OTU1